MPKKAVGGGGRPAQARWWGQLAGRRMPTVGRPASAICGSASTVS